MRIGIYDPYLDDNGGGEKYMMTIASLLSQGHDVSVFWDNTQDLISISKRFSLDMSSVKVVPNIFSPQKSTWDRLIATSLYDVIIFLSDGSIPLVASKKLFIHVQQPFDAFDTSSFIGHLKQYRINKLFCNSEFTLSHIRNKIHCRKTVLYPPVGTHIKNVKKENIIIHVGRFRSNNMQNGDFKKQNVMVDMFRKMCDTKIKDWKFIMAVGLREEDKEAFASMKKSVEGYPIEFYINMTNNQLWDMYNKAKIYWHASGFGEDLQKYPEYAEHFGISTVEAMSVGVVPVVINAGGQKEIVTDGQNGYLWDSKEECIKKTFQLMQNSELLEKFSQSSQKRSKDFTLDIFKEKLLKIIS